MVTVTMLEDDFTVYLLLLGSRSLFGLLVDVLFVFLVICFLIGYLLVCWLREF